MVSYTQPGETKFELWTERASLAGVCMGAVAYGIHLVLFFQCFQLLYRDRKAANRMYLMIYIVTIFTLGTIGNAMDIKVAEMSLIDYRDFPGSTGLRIVAVDFATPSVIGNSVYIVSSWFQDALLIYRFWIIFNRKRWLTAIPILLFLTSMVLSSILIAQLCTPGNTIWSRISVSLGIPYWSISLAMNITLTCLIASRLLLMRARMSKILSDDSTIATNRSPYLSVSAMMIESALLYSVNGLIFLVCYAINSPVQDLALPVLGQTQSIAPLLIIFRVARGRAWSSKTAQVIEHTSIRFADNSKAQSGSHQDSSKTSTASVMRRVPAGLLTFKVEPITGRVTLRSQM
ncbi:hypothetical protein C8J56DRAFT_1005964 [Mycena floridula]|nr:hypothetical protein C8J56DRAFT_1005964 [Mycena floridula]